MLILFLLIDTMFSPKSPRFGIVKKDLKEFSIFITGIQVVFKVDKGETYFSRLTAKESLTAPAESQA